MMSAQTTAVAELIRAREVYQSRLDELLIQRRSLQARITSEEAAVRETEQALQEIDHALDVLNAN